VVPRRWLRGRRIGEATALGRFVDVGDAASLATLRSGLAARAIHYDLAEIDAATIRLAAPRSFTQEVSRFVYEWRDEGGPSPAFATGRVSATNSSTGRSSSRHPRQRVRSPNRARLRSSRRIRILWKQCAFSASHLSEVAGCGGPEPTRTSPPNDRCEQQAARSSCRLPLGAWRVYARSCSGASGEIRRNGISPRAGLSRPI
jgi:hypothetical protein